jgi:hypothetical protein
VETIVDGQKFWIVGGRRLAASAPEVVSDDAETTLYNRDGAVRIAAGPHGIEVKWSVFSPCFASLFYAIEWLPTTSLPIVLRFYLSGWFEEVYPTAEEAVDRIEQIMAKSEIHLTKRAFVKEFDPKGRVLPPIMERTWKGLDVSADTSIDFIFEEKSKKYQIERIGSKSTIAKYYGTSAVSYPYVNGGSYDDIVYEAYTDVLRSGKARYDHVLAAMRMPDNVIRWVPYQRILVPKQNQEHKNIVSVVTEIAEVDIRPI